MTLNDKLVFSPIMLTKANTLYNFINPPKFNEKYSFTQLMKHFKYPQSTQDVLLISELAYKQKYPIIYNSFYNNKVGKDNRTTYDFMQNLVLGWLAEDYVRWVLNYSGKINVKLNGGDCHRDLLNDYASTKADFCMYKAGAENGIKVEFITDYIGKWQTNKIIEFRQNKLIRNIEQKSLIFGIDLLNYKFVLFDTTKPLYYEYSNSLYNKGGHKLDMTKTNVELYELSVDNILSKFDSILLNRRLFL